MCKCKRKRKCVCAREGNVCERDGRNVRTCVGEALCKYVKCLLYIMRGCVKMCVYKSVSVGVQVYAREAMYLSLRVSYRKRESEHI